MNLLSRLINSGSKFTGWVEGGKGEGGGKGKGKKGGRGEGGGEEKGKGKRPENTHLKLTSKNDSVWIWKRCVNPIHIFFSSSTRHKLVD